MPSTDLISEEDLRKMLRDADRSDDDDDDDDDSSYRGTDDADSSKPDDDDDDEQEHADYNDDDDDDDDDDENDENDENDDENNDEGDKGDKSKGKKTRKEKEDQRRRREIEELLQARQKLERLEKEQLEKKADKAGHPKHKGGSPVKKPAKETEDHVLSPAAGDMSLDSLHASAVQTQPEGVYIKLYKENMSYERNAIVVHKGTVYTSVRPKELRPTDYSIVDMTGEGKNHRFCTAVLNRAHNRTEYFELTTTQEREAIRQGTSEKGIRASFPALESRQAASDEGKDFNLDKYAGIFLVVPDVNGKKRAFIFSDNFRKARAERAASDAARRQKTEAAKDAAPETASGTNGGVRRAVVAEAAAAAAAQDNGAKSHDDDDAAGSSKSDVVVTPQVPTKPRSPLAPKRPTVSNDDDGDFVQRVKRSAPTGDDDDAQGSEAKRAKNAVRIQLTFDVEPQNMDNVIDLIRVIDRVRSPHK